MTKDAFITQVVGLRDTLYRISYGLLPNAFDQDDAVQETVKIALLKWHTLRNPNAVKAWIIRVLINECYSILRKKKRETPADNVVVEIPFDGDKEVIEALMELEAKHRLPIILHYFEGYTMREIAKMLVLPESTVKSRMKRAKELLKISMQEGGLRDEIP